MKLCFVMRRLIVLPLIACASCAVCQTPAPGKTDTESKIKVALQPVALPSPRTDIDDKYIRLVAEVTSAGAESSVIFDQPSFLTSLSSKLKGAFWSEDKSLLVTSDALIGGVRTGPRALVMTSPSSMDTPVFGNHVLTPSFQLADGFKLRWSAKLTTNVESSAIQAAVAGLDILTTLIAPHSALMKVLKSAPDLEAKSKEADEKLAKAFSGAEVAGSPELAYDPRSIERFDLKINDKAVVSLKFKMADTLLTADGSLAGVPKDPAALIGRKLDTGSSPSELIKNKKEIMDQLNLGTKPGYSKFCLDSASSLASAGLNGFDRAAIIYAYLYFSPWNTQGRFRADPDPCEMVTAPAAIAGLNLVSRSDIAKQTEAGRKETIRRMNEKKNGIFDRLAGKFEQLSLPFWNDLVGDISSDIVLVSFGFDTKLSNDITLLAGVPNSQPMSVARRALAAARFHYDKKKAIKDGVIEADDGCFSLNESQSSSFYAYCFYPNGGSASQPIPMEFVFDKTFGSEDNPKLVTIRLFPQDMDPIIIARSTGQGQ